MDPSLIPPPPPASVEPAPLHVAHAANPTPNRSPTHNHPPYVEMITGAIAGLKEKKGSSKRAIAKYIETQYKDQLPPNHSALLTQHLKRLKNNGLIVMVKHSYKLPRSGNGNGNAPFDLNSVGSKRRRGRPPKPKLDSVPNALPVFVPVAQNQVATLPVNPQNMAVGPAAVHVSAGPVNGDAAPAAGVGVKRGRGRPPKQDGANRGNHPISVLAQSGGVGRLNAGAATVKKGTGRPRGRPPKPKNALGGVASPPLPAVGVVDPVTVGIATESTLVVSNGGAGLVKRRGRPPKAGRGKTKPRRASGKPVGRPMKNAMALPVQIPHSEQVIQDLKRKLEYLQSRIKHTVNTIKPCLDREAAVAALLELEMLSATEVDALPKAPSQQLL